MYLAEFVSRICRISRIFTSIVCPRVVEKWLSSGCALVERGSGIEAVRMIYKEYRTGLAEDHAQMLSMVLTPTWWKDPERQNKCFADMLLLWDEVTAN